MNRVAIIDLGSNSVHLVIIDLKDNHSHYQIENLEETVRLLCTSDPQGHLSKQGIARAIEAVALFVKFSHARNVKQIIAVATTAVRNAPNGFKLIDQIQQHTGIRPLVLPPEEEAYLGYLGLINNTAETSGLMADLGGGSLKVVSFDNRLNQNTATLDFGAVSLMERFNLNGLPRPADLNRLEDFVKTAFAQLPWLSTRSNVIGLGGTFRTLARVYRRQTGYLPDITDGIVIPVQAIEEIYGSLSKMDLQQRRHVPGLERTRADLSVAGLGIIRQLLLATNSSKLTISSSSIREGILFRHLFPKDPILFNVLTHHTNNLIGYHNLDENHLRKVSNLAVTLFDQLQPLHGLNSRARRLLLIAGFLHELGAVISVENLEKHTLYTVLNSPLPGLTHQERVVVAYLAASHNQLYQVGLKDYISLGPSSLDDIQWLNKLAPLLQIAHSLDRSRTGVVSHIQVHLTPEICELSVFGRPSDLEIRDAGRQKEEFQKHYGPKLVVIKA